MFVTGFIMGSGRAKERLTLKLGSCHVVIIQQLPVEVGKM
jgi:hypothetical protein